MSKSAATAASQNGGTPRLKLKAIIVEHGTTQRKVGRAARIDETRLSSIIRGRAHPTDDEMRRIAKVLKASTRDLFNVAAIALVLLVALLNS